ncbi:MAG: PorT family protein [Tannerellaceae bacterium]|jgi:hypothetical protein|nr:PorT family protein [Tannerellaceae bacterium]
MNKETDSFDDLFRNKLKNLEVDTSPEDWEAIAARLPKAKIVVTRWKWKYAAAVALAFFTAGSGWYLLNRNQENNQDINSSESSREYISEVQTIKDHRADISTDAPELPEQTYTAAIRRSNRIHSVNTKPDPIVEEGRRAAVTTYVAGESVQELVIPTVSAPMGLLFADAALAGAVTIKKSARPAQRKWTFGTALGGLNGGNTNLASTYLLRSSSIENSDLMKLNAPVHFNTGATPRTNIDHKMPLSFGFSVNRILNNRWAISTGIVYTLLRSEWETEGEYRTKTKQHLHFAGIPLAVTYKIAEWNKLSWYASAGGMGELNFAGQESAGLYAGESAPLETDLKRVRMKELQWSLNARTGLSYPLIRYVSLFAEMGLSYHFDSGSKMETVYSRKPLNISPQFGIRLGL